MFKALADPTRRGLLDELFREDGQTLSALEQRLPMTRFGVMKHLKVLEAAGLVVSKRSGREKLHFLNPVPIRLVHDRWVSKYTEPWAAALVGLKSEIEDEQMEKVFEIYIKTTPERLWEAITDPEQRARFTFGVAPDTDWMPGSTYEAKHLASGAVIMAGENLEVDPPRRLVQSFMANGARASRAREPHGSPGRSSRSPTPAACLSPTTSCARTPTQNSMAAGR